MPRDRDVERRSGVAAKVVYQLNSVAMGGMEHHAAELARAVRGAGHDVEAIVPEYASISPLADDLVASGIPVYRLALTSAGGPVAIVGRWVRMVKLLRSLRPDVMHQHRTGPYHGKWACLAAWFAGVRVIVASEHQAAYRQSLPARIVRQGVDRLVDCVVAVSEHDRRTQLEAAGRAPDRIEVVHNGIDFGRFATGNGAAVRRSLGIPPDALIVGSVGRLEQQKGLKYLLRAVSQLGAEWPELRLVIAGDGSLRGALEAEAAALGIEDRVHLLGARNDVPDVLAALDVFAMPSEWEPFGLAAAEAMAAGLPVIASEVGGLPEVVAAGVTGILVPACEPGPLAAGIATLLREPATRRAMGEAGRARVQAEFSAQAMGNRMCSLYERLLGAKGMEVGQ